MAKAWWVNYKDVLKEFKERTKAYASGKGPAIESWTEIMIKEFWPDVDKEA